MSSLAKMKADLNNLREEKGKVAERITRADKQFWVGLWIVGGGITLIPLYGFGLFLLVGGVFYAFFNYERKNTLENKLEDIEQQILTLEASMG